LVFLLDIGQLNPISVARTQYGLWLCNSSYCGFFAYSSYKLDRARDNYWSTITSSIIIWLLARLCWIFIPYEPLFAGLLDLVYLLFLFFAVARPIIKVRQWRQLAIISKLLIIVSAYILFFLGTLGLIPNGAYYGIYLALITEIALILTIARRVFPFFAQAGLGLANPPHSPLWIDRSSLAFFCYG
jgi:uncharacterized protein involved in response to NO